MTIGKLNKALVILNKYSKPHDDLSAEHDEICFPPDNASEVISKEDKLRLEELGFFINEEYDCIQCFT